ncbi:MAG: DivIVA domain-containing protein [Brachybacterium paraconglomeratum]|nr:DivIVA domain-containing protein [Brachybacterium paraconglomeratum]
MTWFFAVVIVLLMGAVAVVAAGGGGSMAETYDARPDARVQAEGPLTGDDLRRVRFTTAFRGYRMSEVDTLLARLADELDAARPAPPAPDAAHRPDTPSTPRCALRHRPRSSGTT